MITPSILTDSLETAQQQLDLVAQKTPFKRVQIDVIDPEFADNNTIHPIDIVDLELHNLEIDVHLMTNDPINDVIECTQIPRITTIIAQIERMTSQKDYFEHVHSYGIGVGFSLDFDTEIEELDHTLLSQASCVQVMANRAGHQGEVFGGERVIQKIQTLQRIKTALRAQFHIAVDIGLNPNTIMQSQYAGADIFAVGSFLWQAPDFVTAVESLHDFV